MSTTNYLKTAFLLALMTGLIMVVGGLLGGERGMLIALVFAGVMNFVTYWFSDKMVLAMYRGREVSPAEAPRFHAIVDRLVARSGLPKPKLYVLPGDSPNAFATGRNPQHAAVAATEGILSLMNDEELEGVIAHELSHVKNRDILISSIAATIAGAITFIAQMAKWGAIFGGGNDRDGGNAFSAIAMMILAPIAAYMMQMALSRGREFQADESGAHLLHDGEPLARALEKIEAYVKQRPMDINPAQAQAYIVNPLTGRKFEFSGLWSSHPPTAERIQRLRSEQF